MAKKIKVNLSPASVDRAIKELEEYETHLKERCTAYGQALKQFGLTRLKAELLPHIDSGETIGSITAIDESTDNTVRFRLCVTSEAILFLEFGAGIKYSSESHPQAGDFGYGPGTYPGQGHWNDPDGWWYQGDDGEYYHTYGQPANKPIYITAQQMREQLVTLARQVFANEK